MSNGDAFDQMIQSYREKLQQNPGSLVFVQLADCYRKKGLLEEATATCEDGLKRNPALLSGQLMMGRIYMARRMHAEAVDALKKVLQKEVNNLTAHALLTQALTAMGRYGEAISEYQKILSLNPEDTSAQKALQALLERMRREKEGAPARSEAPAKPAVAEPVAAPVRTATAPAAPESQEPGTANPPAMEIPAYAAADELAERGLYDEAIEAYQHLLESEPDNFLARQKLRELYAMREAMESPMPSPESGKPVVTVETQAEKMTDDDILALLGLMEGAPEEKAPPKAPEPAPAPKPDPRPEPKPEPKPKPKPEPEAKPAPKSEDVKPVSAPEQVAVVPVMAPEKREKIVPILARLAGTEGMRQAMLVAGQEILHAGTAPAAESTEKITTLVRMLADVTRRASTNMKHGEAKQVLMFGPQGMAVVSQASPGILVLVAGASVKVGLLRLALNDCLKRLAEVN